MRRPRLSWGDSTIFRLTLCTGIIFISAAAAGQAPKPADTKPAKKSPFVNIAGYKVHELAGFTVVVNEEVLKADDSMYKRKPLECLELELKNVSAVMNKKASDALRKVPIWAEWDEVIRLGNGREGKAYAHYYGGTQLSMLSRGMNPQKAQCVVMHLTKNLTESYQEKDRPEQLVMLHELAHAVHDQLLGWENQAVKAAYQQAMARRLYDKSLYIATNEMEFFAEASCAYLDRLNYFPKTREDLKKHDPQTAKLMDAVYGKVALTTEANKSKRPADGGEEFGIDFTIDRIKWPRAIIGESINPDNAKGQVVLLGYVASDQLAIINRFRGWHNEYEPYGLVEVIAQAEYRQDPEMVAARFRRLRLPIPVLDETFAPLKSGGTRSERAGHVILFDTTGQCIFRGQADDATIYLKEAIGKRIFQGLGIKDDSIPMALMPTIQALKAGEPLAQVASKAQSFIASDADVAEPAKKLLVAITEPGTKLFAKATGLKKTNPLEAYLLAEQVATRFKGLNIANKASALVNDLKFEKAVASELNARKDLEAVLKIETQLTSQAGSFNPRDPNFRSKNSATLWQLKAACDLMQKKRDDESAHA